MIFRALAKPLTIAAFILAAAAFELGLHYALAFGANQNGRMIFGFALILLARKNSLSAKIVLFLALGAIAFSVVGLSYGRLTPDFIGALMETNVEEAKEFVSMINPLDLAFACLLCALLVFALFGFANNSLAFAPPPPARFG